MRLGALVEQNDDQQAQQGEGDVAVDTPGQGRAGAEPLVLRHHAQNHTQTGQTVDSSGDTLLAGDLIMLPPYIVQQNIEHGHGDRSDPLAYAQRHGEIFQTGGAQRQGPGHQMEGIAGTQNHSHPAKQAELVAALAAADHQDADGDNRYQIDGIKNGFYNCLHKSYSFYVLSKY